MQQLQQTRPYLRQHFEILHGKLKVTREAPFEKKTVEIQFEELVGTSLTSKYKLNWNLIKLSAFLLIVLCAKLYFQVFGNKQDYGVTLFVVCLLSFFLLLVYVTRKKTLLLAISSNKSIEFFEESPNKETVHAFINDLKSQLKEYLLMKYAKRDDHLTNEQYIERLN